MLTALMLSLLAHASPRLASLARRLAPEPATLASWAPAPRVDFRVARMELVARARKDRREHKLDLGTFLLDGAAIDAAEAQVPLDRARAASEYERRLRRLRAKLHSGSDIQSAFSRVFGDLHYRGIAGGSMAEALLDGGGSCEPLSQLVAAALHDAGYSEQAFIRRYGGGEGHLAPIYLFRGAEHDIVRGGPAFPGGVRFAAADLVEIYAIAHGLPGERGPPAGGRVMEIDSPKNALSLSAGYPPNADRYPGNVPLYAEHALASPGSPRATVRGGDSPWPCTSSGALLFPARVAMLAPKPYEVELFELPSRRDLSDLAAAASVWETENTSTKTAAERLVWQACLALVHEELADGFAAWSFEKLASIAAQKAERWRRSAIAIAESADRKQLARTLATVPEAWMLLAIEQADALLLAALASTAAERDSVAVERIEFCAALLAHERTRARALKEVAKMAFSDQRLVAGMLRFYAEGHAHPLLRPVHLGAQTEFARGYHLFAALNDRLDALRTQNDDDQRALLRWVREQVGPTWAAGIRDLLLKK